MIQGESKGLSGKGPPFHSAGEEIGRESSGKPDPQEVVEGTTSSSRKAIEVIGWGQGLGCGGFEVPVWSGSGMCR